MPNRAQSANTSFRLASYIVYVASAVAGVVRLASYIVYVASAVAGVVRLASDSL